jgi:hypothetical protein
MPKKNRQITLKEIIDKKRKHDDQVAKHDKAIGKWEAYILECGDSEFILLFLGYLFQCSGKQSLQ